MIAAQQNTLCLSMRFPPVLVWLGSYSVRSQKATGGYGWGARQDFAQSHPRQWVDASSSAYQRSLDHSVNPTHGSGWIVQGQPSLWNRMAVSWPSCRL